MQISDKTVLITGGTKGIGRAVVLAFGGQGANVIVNYSGDKVAAEAVIKELERSGGRHLAIQANIANQHEIAAMFEKVSEAYGTLDILVNNAGIFSEADSPDNLHTFKEVFATNFFAQIDVTRNAVKLMQKGKIIFISSIHAKLGSGRPSAIGYSSSKAALESYMKNLTKDLAPDVIVNAIAPGRTLTPMWGKMTEEEARRLAEGHLINRWIEPHEIADGVLFLAKNDAVCGEVLVIDGGMSLKTLG